MASNAQRIQFLLAQGDGFTRSRLPALYADFLPLRATNPEGFAANVAAWRRALAALVWAGLLPGATSTTTSVLVLTAGPPLVDALASDRYGRPVVLPAVVAEAAREGALVPLARFLQARREPGGCYSSSGTPNGGGGGGGGGWTAWAAGLPLQALAWGVRQLTGGPAFDTQTTAADYVVVANVAAAAAAFAARTADLRAGAATAYERTWTVAHFKRTFGAPGVLVAAAATTADDHSGRCGLSDTDLDVLLAYLARDAHAVAFDGQVVRLRDARDQNQDPGPITDADRAAAQVRELVDALTHQTAVLSRRVDDLAAAARAAARQPDKKATALAALRSKKQVEAVLAGRFATLAPLEAVAAQLQQAADHVQVVQAMDAGAAALHALHAQVGGAQGAGAVAARLRQQMDAADEVGRILAEPGLGGADADADADAEDDMLDTELAALAEEEAAKATKASGGGAVAAPGETAPDTAEATRQRLAAVGAVPQTLPGQADAEADATAARLQDLSLGT